MNAKRRKAIDAIVGALKEQHEAFKSVQQEEDSAFSNTPESLQTESGEDRLNDFDMADSEFDSLIASLEELAKPK